MKPETSLMVTIQALKTSYVLITGAFFKLLLIDVPNAGPWNCVFQQNVCIIGPYSPQWYSFYRFFAQIGYTPEIVLFCVIDSLIVVIISRIEPLSYSLTVSAAGFFFLFYDPGDLLIYWLALLSRGEWFLSITAIATKLPIGASLAVWQYVWSISLPAINHSTLINPVRWSLLAVFVLQPLWKRLSWPNLTLAEHPKQKTTSNT